MASPTNYANALILANNNTFVGPVVIKCIKVSAGGDAARLTLTSNASGTPEVYNSGNVAANTQVYDHDLYIRIPSGDTITVALTGTSPKATIYLP